jgi:hypothetical protein
MEKANIEVLKKMILDAEQIKNLDGPYACKIINLLDTIYCLASLLTDCNDATINPEQLGYQIQEVVGIIIDRIDCGEFEAVDRIKKLTKQLQAAA